MQVHRKPPSSSVARYRILNLTTILGQRADLSGRFDRYGCLQEGFHGPGRHEEGLHSVSRPPSELGHRVAHKSHHADRRSRRSWTPLPGPPAPPVMQSNAKHKNWFYQHK